MIQSFGGKTFGKFGKLQEIRQNFPSYKQKYSVHSQLAKLCFKSKHHIVIFKIDSKFYRLDSSQPASQCNTRKIAQLLLSHNVSASRQPTSSSSLQDQLNLQEQIPSFTVSNYKPLSPSLLHSQLAILQSRITKPYFCAAALPVAV